MNTMLMRRSDEHDEAENLYRRKFHRQLLGSWAILFGTIITALSQPVITRQPTNESVSLRAAVSFSVFGITTNPPIAYQWRLDGTNLPLSTNSILPITGIQLTNAGAYNVVLTDGSGSVTSQVAILEVDATFTKIITGHLVTDPGSWGSCVWGDYDNDGFVDLFLTSAANGSGLQRNALYRNNRDGTFSRAIAGAMVTEARDWRGCAWGDYDDDGYLDLLVSNVDGNGFPDQIILYRNTGNGKFSRMSSSIHGPTATGGLSEGCAWGDYDNDGFLDAYVARYGTDWLLHNNGDGTLMKVAGGIPTDNQDSYTAVWGDYNNDGWPDLFVVVKNDFQTNQYNFLYENNSDGTFRKVLEGAVATDNEHSFSCSWVDYDNDGYLDLFVANGTGDGTPSTNSLYHNNGDGTFTKQTYQEAGSIVTDAADFGVATWGDYDNDGWQDLYVITVDGGANFLYHNNGDGTFSRILSGSPVNDTGFMGAPAWGDYDNDGFLDLVVTRGVHDNSTNLQYHNNCNPNTWLKVKLVGTISNRSAIGAKVRVKATVAGKTSWQLREVNSGNGFTAGPLEAHFGLGDATNIDTVQIQWPSGIVQVMTNVAPRQTLTVTEHQDNGAGVIRITGVQRSTNGVVSFSASGQPGVLYRVEASTNLVAWIKLGVRTNLTGSVEFSDPAASSFNRRFYRVLAP